MSHLENHNAWDRIFNDGFTAFIGRVDRQLSSDAAQTNYFRFTLEPHHMAADGAVSRALLMALMDTMLWATVLNSVHGTLDPPSGHSATTVSLNADFLGTARAGDVIYGFGEISRRTRTIAFVSGRLFTKKANEDERGVLSSLGVWKILAA